MRTFRTPGTPLDTTGWQTVIVDCFFVKPIDPDGEMIDFASRVARCAEMPPAVALRWIIA